MRKHRHPPGYPPPVRSLEHAGLVGTAKDVQAAREEADKDDDGKVIDYQRIIDGLASIRGAA